MRFVKIGAFILGLFIFGIGTVLTIGASLPETHEITRSVTVAQPPEAVWKVLEDGLGQAAWRSELVQVRPLPLRSGHEAWKEEWRDGEKETVEVAESDPPLRQVRTLARESGSFEAKWVLDVAPEKGRTRITLREEGSYTNPFARFRTYVFEGNGVRAESFLRQLAAKLGEPNAPVSH